MWKLQTGSKTCVYSLTYTPLTFVVKCKFFFEKKHQKTKLEHKVRNQTCIQTENNNHLNKCKQKVRLNGKIVYTSTSSVDGIKARAVCLFAWRKNSNQKGYARNQLHTHIINMRRQNKWRTLKNFPLNSSCNMNNKKHKGKQFSLATLL